VRQHDLSAALDQQVVGPDRQERSKLRVGLQPVDHRGHPFRRDPGDRAVGGAEAAVPVAATRAAATPANSPYGVARPTDRSRYRMTDNTTRRAARSDTGRPAQIARARSASTGLACSSAAANSGIDSACWSHGRHDADPVFCPVTSGQSPR
jgi:hypothetical protein